MSSRILRAFFRTVFVTLFFGMWLSGSSLWAWPAAGEWRPVYKNRQLLQDPNGDTNGSRNIVSDATHAALFLFNDGTYLHFRIRLDQSPAGQGGQGLLQAYGWGVEFDTNRNAGNYEWLIMLDGISQVENIALRRNDIQATLGDPSDKAETLSSSLPLAGNYQISAADTAFNGSQDYFLDWRFPYATLKALTGLADSTPLRIFAGSSSSANNLTENGADLLGGSDLYSGFSDFFTAMGVSATTGSVRFVADLAGNGDVTLAGIGSPLFIRVDDGDQNSLPGQAETVMVELTTSDGDRAVLTLTETGANTGIFTGSIPTVLTRNLVATDTVLQIQTNTGVNALYVDLADARNQVDQPRTDALGFLPPAAPALSLTKTVTPAAPIPGDEITYTIDYTNAGTGAAHDVVVNDQVPVNTTYKAGSLRVGTATAGYGDAGNTVLTDAVGDDAGACDGSSVQVRLAIVAPGARGRVFFKVTLN
ncbi:MAG TPA: hypothetical protein PLP29_19290 [Candidatus Ozemobacteraceae bacterium]|nr:hypothetical protein [Candidatus Ozemobacteraceae bacterium]